MSAGGGHREHLFRPLRRESSDDIAADAAEDAFHTELSSLLSPPRSLEANLNVSFPFSLIENRSGRRRPRSRNTDPVTRCRTATRPCKPSTWANAELKSGHST